MLPLQLNTAFNVHYDSKINYVMLNDAIIANGLILWYNASQRSVTHDSLRYINILTYLLTYLLTMERDSIQATSSNPNF